MKKAELFIYGFIVICIGAGVVTRLAPDGVIKKYFKYIVSLCVLAAMMSPLINALGIITKIDTTIIFDDVFTSEEIDAEKILIENEKLRIEAAIEKEIERRWEMSEGDVEVNVVLDSSNKQAVEIKQIDVIVADSEKSDEIKEYIDGLFYGTAKVTVSGEKE